jgi:hypothetical protein
MSNKISFNQLAELVTEDQVAQSDKWATGISGRFMGPSQITLVDLLKKYDHQHPNNTKAPGGMPHSTQMLLELIGDLVVQADHIQKAFDLALENPVLDDKEEAITKLKSMSRKVSQIKQIVSSISDDVDNFSIESSNK